MKRDWRLIRNLLMKVEDNSISYSPSSSAGLVIYHLKLLSDGGFIEKTLDDYWLQWRGAELLESLRNEQTFESAMKLIDERGLGATEEILVALIKQQSAQKR